MRISNNKFLFRKKSLLINFPHFLLFSKREKCFEMFCNWTNCLKQNVRRNEIDRKIFDQKPKLRATQLHRPLLHSSKLWFQVGGGCPIFTVKRIKSVYRGKSAIRIDRMYVVRMFIWWTYLKVSDHCILNVSHKAEQWKDVIRPIVPCSKLHSSSSN